MNRRDFLKGFVATTAGVLVPSLVLAEPERRIYALDQTMLPAKGRGSRAAYLIVDEVAHISSVEWPVYWAMNPTERDAYARFVDLNGIDAFLGLHPQ